MDTPLILVFYLLILFQIKHFLGDFILQTSWMVRGKGECGTAYIWPLFAHASVHAGLSFLILLAVAPQVWFLAIFDLAAHACTDLLKSSRHFFGRYGDPSQKSYWIPFGADQLLHHLTHYFIIFVIAANA